MVERFTSKDGHPPQVIESGELLNPFQNDQTPGKDSTPRDLPSQRDIESGGLIDPFKKTDSIPDTMTLNPFKHDAQHTEPRQFLNPFEDFQRPRSTNGIDFATLHRPTFPDKVDGAEAYIVKPGDSLWKIAKEVLTKQTGTTPSSKEVAATVKAMAKILGDDNSNSLLLRPGDKVFVPLPKQDKVEPKPSDKTTDGATGDTKSDVATCEKGNDGLWHPVDKDSKPLAAKDGSAITTSPAEATEQTKASMCVNTEAQEPVNECTADTPDGKEVSASSLATVLSDLATTVKQQIVAAFDAAVCKAPATQASESPAATQTSESGEPTTQEAKDFTPATPALIMSNSTGFSPQDDVYSPVRPPGIGELTAGESTESDTNTGIDWRKSIGKRPEKAHMTVYTYEGELEDSGLLSADTGFKAEERVDENGSIVSTEVTYDQPISIKFKSFDGTSVELNNVSSIQTTRRESGEYVSSVTADGGTNYTFVTAADGTVTSFDFN